LRVAASAAITRGSALFAFRGSGGISNAPALFLFGGNGDFACVCALRLWWKRRISNALALFPFGGSGDFERVGPPPLWWKRRISNASALRLFGRSGGFRLRPCSSPLVEADDFDCVCAFRLWWKRRISNALALFPFGGSAGFRLRLCSSPLVEADNFERSGPLPLWWKRRISNAPALFLFGGSGGIYPPEIAPQIHRALALVLPRCSPPRRALHRQASRLKLRQFRGTNSSLQKAPVSRIVFPTASQLVRSARKPPEPPPKPSRPCREALDNDSAPAPSARGEFTARLGFSAPLVSAFLPLPLRSSFCRHLSFRTGPRVQPPPCPSHLSPCNFPVLPWLEVSNALAAASHRKKLPNLFPAPHPRPPRALTPFRRGRNHPLQSLRPSKPNPLQPPQNTRSPRLSIATLPPPLASRPLNRPLWPSPPHVQ